MMQYPIICDHDKMPEVLTEELDKGMKFISYITYIAGDRKKFIIIFEEA